MNKYSISKVIEAMEDEIKDCFHNIVKDTHTFDRSIITLKENLTAMISRDTKIKEILEKYLEE